MVRTALLAQSDKGNLVQLCRDGAAASAPNFKDGPASASCCQNTTRMVLHPSLKLRGQYCSPSPPRWRFRVPSAQPLRVTRLSRARAPAPQPRGPDPPPRVQRLSTLPRVIAVGRGVHANGAIRPGPYPLIRLLWAPEHFNGSHTRQCPLHSCSCRESCPRIILKSVDPVFLYKAWAVYPCSSQWVLHPCTSQWVLHPCKSQWLLHP